MIPAIGGAIRRDASCLPTKIYLSLTLTFLTVLYQVRIIPGVKHEIKESEKLCLNSSLWVNAGLKRTGCVRASTSADAQDGNGALHPFCRADRKGYDPLADDCCRRGSYDFSGRVVCGGDSDYCLRIYDAQSGKP